MKKYLLAGSTLVAALSIASAAHAADMTAPAAYDWSGFYIGANAGVAWSNASVDQSTYIDGVRQPNLSNSLDSDSTAFTAGGILGYNYQMDQIVLGVETDFNYLGFGDDRRRNIGQGAYATTNFEADWFGTIRARLGFAVDNVLIYGTGGAAYGNMNADGKLFLGEDLVWKGSTDSTRWGWTLGAGAEYGIDNWSLGVEYLYVDLGSDDYKSNTIDLDPGIANFKGDVDYAFSTVRASVKYRFQ